MAAPDVISLGERVMALEHHVEELTANVDRLIELVEVAIGIDPEFDDRPVVDTGAL